MSRTLTVNNLDCLDVVLNVTRSMLDKFGKLTVTVEEFKTDSGTRSDKQNRLSFAWYKHIANELEDGTVEEKRAYCKLHFGVPIRRENEKFREVYDRVIRPLTYEQKIEIMVGSIDFPVTRDMGVKDMGRYLEAMEVFFASIGVPLPRPDDLYFAAMGLKK